MDKDHLLLIGKYWYYQRRVPADVSALCGKRFVKKTTKKTNESDARIIARRFNAETESYWQALLEGKDDKTATDRYSSAICKKLAAFGGSYSESTMSSCMDMEQNAYNDLKPKWPSLSTRIQSYCDRLAKFGGGGSYSTLKSCIAMEKASEEKNKTRKFKF